MDFEPKTLELRVPLEVRTRIAEDFQDNTIEDGREVRLHTRMHVGTGGVRLDYELNSDGKAAPITERDYSDFTPLTGSPEGVDEQLAAQNDADPLDVIYGHFVHKAADKTFVESNKASLRVRECMQRGAGLLLYGVESGYLIGMGVTAVFYESIDQNASDAMKPVGAIFAVIGLAGALLSRRTAQMTADSHQTALCNLQNSARREAVLSLVQDEVMSMKDAREAASQLAESEPNQAEAS